MDVMTGFRAIVRDISMLHRLLCTAGNTMTAPLNEPIFVRYRDGLRFSEGGGKAIIMLLLC